MAASEIPNVRKRDVCCDAPISPMAPQRRHSLAKELNSFFFAPIFNDERLTKGFAEMLRRYTCHPARIAARRIRHQDFHSHMSAVAVTGERKTLSG